MNFNRAQPNFFLSETDYYQLTGPGFYNINEVPADRHRQLPDHFGTPDSFVIFASGVAPYIAQRGGTEAVGGIDWIRLESNRKAGEPPLNVYHFIIGPSGIQGFPVYGPFHNGGIVPHWPSEEYPFDPYPSPRPNLS